MNGESPQFESDYRKFVLLKLRNKNFITQVLMGKNPFASIDFFCDFVTPSIAVHIACSGRFEAQSSKDSRLWLTIFDYNAEKPYKTLARKTYVNKSKTYSGETYYRSTYIPSKRHFPQGLLALLKANGLLMGKKNTEQRFIAALNHNIRAKDVHHINYNPFDNHIFNLLPIEKKSHTKYFHPEPNICCYSVENEAFGNKILEDKLDAIAEQTPKTNASKYNNTSDIIKILELHRVEKMSAVSIDKKRKTLERKHNAKIPRLTKLEKILATYRRVFDLAEFKKFCT